MGSAVFGFSSGFFSPAVGAALGSVVFGFSSGFFSPAVGVALGAAAFGFSSDFFSPAVGAAFGSGALGFSSAFFFPTMAASFVSGVLGGSAAVGLGEVGSLGVSFFCWASVFLTSAPGAGFASGISFLLQVSRNGKCVPTWDALFGSMGG